MRRRALHALRTPVTLLLMLGLLAFAARWGYLNAISAPTSPRGPTPCVERTLPRNRLASRQVVVRVFNGGGRVGLAADVGRELRERGFRVPLTGNTGEKVRRTVVVGATVRSPEVLLVKAFFDDAEVRAEPAGKVDGTVDVLVGTRYGGMRAARTTLRVKSGVACLAAQTGGPAAAG